MLAMHGRDTFSFPGSFLMGRHRSTPTCRPHTAVRRCAHILALGALAVLAACAGPRRNYAPPVASDNALNQWTPYVQEASHRFTIPQAWIRAIMRQESGGHQYLHGHLTRSIHGAVGLMHK